MRVIVGIGVAEGAMGVALGMVVGATTGWFTLIGMDVAVGIADFAVADGGTVVSVEIRVAVGVGTIATVVGDKARFVPASVGKGRLFASGWFDCAAARSWMA